MIVNNKENKIKDKLIYKRKKIKLKIIENLDDMSEMFSIKIEYN